MEAESTAFGAMAVARRRLRLRAENVGASGQCSMVESGIILVKRYSFPRVSVVRVFLAQTLPKMEPRQNR